MAESREVGSISACFAKLAAGDDEAVRQLWERYFDSLLGVARKHLGPAPRRSFDEEDVAVSVFECLRRGAQEGRFVAMRDRTELWKLLVTIAKQKAIDRVRHETAQKRGGGAVYGESDRQQTGGAHADVHSIDDLIASEPTPEELAQIEEQKMRLFSLLRDGSVRRVAVYRLQGYTNQETASLLGITTRSVERKLRLIRQTWQRELEQP